MVFEALDVGDAGVEIAFRCNNCLHDADFLAVDVVLHRQYYRAVGCAAFEGSVELCHAQVVLLDAVNDGGILNCGREKFISAGCAHDAFDIVEHGHVGFGIGQLALIVALQSEIEVALCLQFGDVVSLAVSLQTVFNVAQFVGYVHKTVENEGFGLHGGTVAVLDYASVVDVEYGVDDVYATGYHIGGVRHVDNLVALLHEVYHQILCNLLGHVARAADNDFLGAFQLRNS